MIKDLFEYVKKFGIFAVLFCALFVWNIHNYERRELEYIKHVIEYNQIVNDSQKIIIENQKLMAEYQEQLKGFKLIIEVRLDAIQKELECIRK